MLQQQDQHTAKEQTAAQRGSRPGITRGAVPEGEAAEQLYTAEQMLAANTRLQAARCAYVEGLILCQRYAEAQAACEGLMEGADRLYLQAELEWRQGGLEAAAASLDQALAAAAGCHKCSDLRQFVRRLDALWHDAQLAKEDGALQRCDDCCAELLAAVEPRAAPGLCCKTLHLRAEAHADRGLWAAAREDLGTALQLDASHAACLQLRAEAHQQLGCFLEAVLDLQRLQKVAPGTPGLFAMLEKAAKLCLSGQQGQRGGSAGSGSGTSAVGGCVGSCTEAFAVLGLGPVASAAQVRQAYLKLAAKWHPDKWAAASEEERQAAEGKFKEVKKAYEALAA